MSGVQPLAPHEALAPLLLAGFAGGAPAPCTGATAFFGWPLAVFAVAAGPAAEAAGVSAGGEGAASGAAAGKGVSGATPGCAGFAADGVSGAGAARSALAQPTAVPALRTASAVTNVSRLSEGFRIPPW